MFQNIILNAILVPNYSLLTLTTLESQILVVFTLIIPSSKEQLCPLKMRCGPGLVDSSDPVLEMGAVAFSLQVFPRVIIE